MPFDDPNFTANSAAIDVVLKFEVRPLAPTIKIARRKVGVFHGSWFGLERGVPVAHPGSL